MRWAAKEHDFCIDVYGTVSGPSKFGIDLIISFLKRDTVKWSVIPYTPKLKRNQSMSRFMYVRDGHK
jgi:hypothetical protein